MATCTTAIPHTVASSVTGRGLLGQQGSSCTRSEAGQSADEQESSEKQLTPQTLHDTPPVHVFEESAHATGEERALKDNAANEKSPRSPQTDARPLLEIEHSAKDRGAVKDVELSRVLVDGYVLANRYVMRSDEISSRHACRFADDRFTGERVFLRFYPRSSTELQQAVKMYKLLRNCKAVCKQESIARVLKRCSQFHRLVEILSNAEGLQPCLVFEAGSYTLAQRLESKPLSPLEQQGILQSISQVLCELHGRKVVHGDLDPSRIMWFNTDFCWKLVNLQAASGVGDVIPIRHITSHRYAAPEIRIAIEQDAQQTRADASSDMYAFGLISFEVLTGASVLDAEGVKRYIAQERRCLEACHENEAGPARAFSKSVEQRLLEFDFIKALLADRPIERRTASLALDAASFGAFPEDEDPAKALFDFFRGGGTLNRSVYRLGRWIFCHVALTYLDLSVSVERFAPNGDSGAAFYEKSKGKMKQFFDDYLPKYPVNVLIAGESFRIRISIGRDRQLRFPFDGIASVKVIPPDSEGQSVEIWQQNAEYKLDALAFVDPSKFGSERLNKRCPIFGLVDTKYVRLTIHVTLRLGDDFPYDIDVYPPVYLQLKRPTRQCGFLKCCRA